jgi:UDP-2,4-diacetamido-2,4,6-trideoxy-beta-L-altropyranose hydrolase
MSLRRKGQTVSFVCRELEGHLATMIASKGFEVHLLECKATAEMSTAPGSPVSAVSEEWRADADETAVLIKRMGERANWMIVDHYGLDHRWETALRSVADRLMAIDDLANRQHDCDILLDQNLVADMESRYAGKVAVGCSLLLGPEYALLQAEYALVKKAQRTRQGQVKRIFAFFGGVDAHNSSEMALDAFLRVCEPDIHLDIVVGPGSRHAESLRVKASQHCNVHIHGALPSLAPLMAKSDIAIGAGGTTTWERLCLGLPALVVTVSDNQIPLTEELDRRGLVRWLGHEGSVCVESMASMLRELVEGGVNDAWRVRCAALVDGLGVERVCAGLLGEIALPVAARCVTLGDEELLLKWSNDPATRRSGFNPDPIPAEDHSLWLRRLLNAPERCRFCIVESADGVPLGQTRFELAQAGWEIHYSVAPAFRGHGLGFVVLDSALRWLRAKAGAGMAFGQVKSDNVPSRRVFEKLNFEADPETAGRLVFRRSN